MSALRWLNWAGHVLLGIGLFAPCMTVTPRLGAYTGLGQWLGLVRAPQTYSILEGVRALLENHRVLGAIVFLFSVVFPLSKLVILRAGLEDARAGRPASGAQRITNALSKYSMVDVFVIALLIVAGKSYPGGTTVDVHWGAYAFAAAALVSIPVASGLRQPPEMA